MKLFQFIVTDDEVRGAANKIRSETIKVFNGRDLFNGVEKVYQPKDTEGEQLEPTHKNVVTTVHNRLEYTMKYVGALLDFEATRDKTNCKAVADLVIDGKTLAAQVPAVTLLSLEKRLAEVRAYYDAIPTLDLSKKWEKVKDDEGKWQYGPIQQFKTAKKTKAVVLYEATEKHPAQVKEVVEDVTIGTWATTSYSGELHPGEKAACIARIDKLIEAVKKARMNANEATVEKLEVGAALFSYIHTGGK